MKYILLLPVCTVLIFAAGAHASEIIYRGINPEITPTANPNNETAVSNFYNISKPNPAPTATQQLSESDILKQSILNGLSSYYVNLLTGPNSGNGSFRLPDGTIYTYTTVGDIRTTTETDPNGNVTTYTQTVTPTD